MSSSSIPLRLKPALGFRHDIAGQTHWVAWDTEGRCVLEGMGTFQAFDGRLRSLGYYQLPPNSDLAMEIRAILWERRGA